MCLDEGTLQAFIDNQISLRERHHIEMHLAECADCRQKLTQIQENNYFTTAHLNIYTNSLDSNEQVTRLPLPDLNYLSENIKHTEKERSPQKGVVNVNKYKKIIATAAVAACLAASMAFSPVRAVAEDLLKVFRVDKVQSVNIDPKQLEQVSQVFYNAKKEMKIDDFGEFTTDSNKYSPPKSVPVEEAKKQVNIKLPKYLPQDMKRETMVNIGPENKVNFKLNVKNVNAVLKYLGAKKLLPENLEGKTFSVYVPSNANIQWRSSGNINENTRYLSIFQSQSPELTVPKGVNVEQIRSAIIELPILPVEVKQGLASVKDWQHTLPVPAARSETRQVDINGVAGLYVQRQNSNGYSTLIFKKDGILTVIEGNLSFDEKVKVARSMR